MLLEQGYSEKELRAPRPGGGRADPMHATCGRKSAMAIDRLAGPPLMPPDAFYVHYMF